MLQKALAKQQALLIGDASKDDEDDSEDDDGDEEEDDEDSDDEETPASRAKGIATLKKAFTAAPINGQEFSDMDDDDMEVGTHTHTRTRTHLASSVLLCLYDFPLAVHMYNSVWDLCGQHTAVASCTVNVKHKQLVAYSDVTR